jgi:hypothetical protein
MLVPVLINGRLLGRDYESLLSQEMIDINRKIPSARGVEDIKLKAVDESQMHEARIFSKG